MKKITCFVILLLGCTFTAMAQPVSGYLFTQETEVYTPVLGASSTATGDDGIQNAIPIGFNFGYGSGTYSTFSISTNGWIRLGGDVGGQSWTNNLSNTSTQAPLIAPFWDDNNRTTGDIQYNVSGFQPARVLEIGWNNINIGNNGNVNAADFGSFKMRIYETSGRIEFVYGPTMVSAGNLTASIGLNDLGSFLSVTPAAISTSSGSLANNAITATDFVVGQKFIFLPQPHCSGTPNPGNTISSNASVCSNVSFTLGLQNSALGFGQTYQWYSSTDGINFLPIAGAVASGYIATQTVTKSYRCEVTCDGNTATSAPVQVTVNSPAQCYCLPTYTNGKTDGDLISNVVIVGTTLANDTGAVPANPYYTYFTGQPSYTAVLNAGYIYTMNVTVGTYQDQNESVWIDYNDDAVFSESERVGYSEAISGSGTGIFTIALDCNAPGGIHRMRVRDVYQTDASTMDACSNYGYGETEDYDITIVASTGCQAPSELDVVTVNPTSAELTWAVGCGQLGWDVHVTEQGGGLPTDAPSNLNVHHPAIISGLTPATTYEFYVRGFCAANGLSDWVGPFTFTTLAPGPANDDCEGAQALIPGGTFEEHAVIGTNVSATLTVGQPNPTCAVFGFGGDVWYAVVVPEDGNITIEVQADPGSPFADSGLTAFTGTCGNLTTIGCSDDEGLGAFSRLNLTGLNPNETIYARVWEYANDTFGTFQVSAWNPLLKTSEFELASFSVYPNPVKDILDISSAKNISNVEVFNMLGQQVISKTLQATQGKIDMSHLPSGTYMVKASADGGTKTIKVIKE